LAINIPEDKLVEIRNIADIVDIISERVVLKKSGKDLSGLCPFHSEKTPSFTVSRSKQMFYCFGCGAGGDIFNFLMKHDGINFTEAVESLAKRYGVVLPSAPLTPEQRRKLSEREQLFEINQQVMAFYQSCLRDADLGKKARSYLDGRGFSEKILSSFGVGYAPESWDRLVRFLRNKHRNLKPAEVLGLIVPRKSDGYYDRFRDRVVFPIFDVTRRVVGFGGRVIADGGPKYLNSPESPIYHKSRSLYGVHAARDRCRETGCVYIVEGYLDVLAMHQHGFTNTVATLGTSLTVEHVRMLRRGFAKKAYLVFDSDAAGMRAAHRSASIFMDESVDAAILVLPEGHDPDSFLREFGARAFRETSDNARGTMTFLIEAAIKKHGLSMEGRVRVIDDLLQPLGTLSDHLVRSVYVRDLAERLNIDESAIVDKIRRTARQSNAVTVAATSKENGSFSGDRIEKSSGISELFRIERQIIAMMIHAPELVEHIETEGVLNYFYDRRLRKIGDLILSRPASARHDLNGLMHDLDDPELRELAASLAMESGNWGTQSCRTLINQYIGANQRRGDTLLNRIREAGNCNDLDLQFSLLKEKQRQIRRRQ
jgi:DNA primase